MGTERVRAMSYAATTTVSSDKSRAEIERTLSRYGASSFMYGWSQTHAQVAFDMHGRRIHFKLPMPDKTSEAFTKTPTGKPRVAKAAEEAYEQAVRQRWRALSLVIKAKLEAVEAGITVFDEEFLAHIVLPNGGTVGQFMLPQVETAYVTGNMPPLLPSPGDQS